MPESSQESIALVLRCTPCAADFSSDPDKLISELQTDIYADESSIESSLESKSCRRKERDGDTDKNATTKCWLHGGD